MKLLPPADRSSLSLRYIISAYFSSYVLALTLTFALMGFKADSALTGLLGNGLYLVAFALMALTLEKQKLLQFTRTKPTFVQHVGTWYAWACLAVPIGIALRLAGDAVFIIFEHSAAIIEFKELMDTNYQKAGGVTTLGLVSTLVAASTEELIDRRILFPLLTQRLGIVAGTIVAGTVFGLMHLGYEAIFPGIVLSMIYVVSGRIWVCIAVHVTGNLFYPLARVLHLRMDWAAYQAISIAMLILLLSIAVWTLVAVRRRAAQPVSEAPPQGSH